jgi:hypothetical protein
MYVVIFECEKWIVFQTQQADTVYLLDDEAAQANMRLVSDVRVKADPSDDLTPSIKIAKGQCHNL